MRKIIRLIFGTAILFGGITHLNASVTLTFQDIPLTSASSTTANGILKGNGSGATASTGWHGVLISIVADAGSQKIAGFDLNTGTYGIFGTFAQRWTIDGGTGLTVPNSTVVGGIPSGTSSSTLADSFFSSFTNLGLSPSVAFTEDNNLANGPNGPYNRNPVPDVPADLNNGINGIDYGVGTFLKGAGTFTTNNLPFGQPVPIAFVIVDSDFDLTVRGIFIDGQSPAHAWLFDPDIFGEQTIPIDLGPVPEPASLLTLGLGGLALLRKNRRAASLPASPPHE